jgi:hypothetical protein
MPTWPRCRRAIRWGDLEDSDKILDSNQLLYPFLLGYSRPKSTTFSGQVAPQSSYTQCYCKPLLCGDNTVMNDDQDKKIQNKYQLHHNGILIKDHCHINLSRLYHRCRVSLLRTTALFSGYCSLPHPKLTPTPNQPVPVPSVSVQTYRPSISSSLHSIAAALFGSSQTHQK